MKKLLLLSGFMFFTFIPFLQAQIEDGGFETKWVEKPADRGVYWDFNVSDAAMLRTLNSLYAIEIQEFITELTSFREANTPHQGQYAMRMRTASFQNVILVPGIYATVPYDYIPQYINNKGFEAIVDFESPASGDKPQRLTGYYKYSPVKNDSAAIEIELFNRGTSVAFALWKERNTVSEWTKFDIPIRYTLDADINEIKLIFASSAGYNFELLDKCKGEVGSTFWIDDIAFEYGDVGLIEPLMERSASQVYPNPASDAITISFDQELNGKLVIYNVLGAEAAIQSVNGDKIEANITNLPAGSYFYRVIEGNKIRTSGKFIIE